MKIAKVEEAKKKSREDFKRITELSTELQEEKQLAATSKLVKEKKAEEDIKRIMELGRLLQKEREKIITLEQNIQEEKAKVAQAPQSHTFEQIDSDSGKSSKMRARSKTLSSAKKPTIPVPVVVAPVVVNQDSLRMRAQLLEMRKLQQEQSAIEARLACECTPPIKIAPKAPFSLFYSAHPKIPLLSSLLAETGSRQRAEKELSDLQSVLESTKLELEEAKNKITDITRSMEVEIPLLLFRLGLPPHLFSILFFPCRNLWPQHLNQYPRSPFRENQRKGRRQQKRKLHLVLGWLIPTCATSTNLRRRCPFPTPVRRAKIPSQGLFLDPLFFIVVIH